MKASVQYGDFKGTSAADISDHVNLEKVINRLGIDTDKYEPIGAKFFFGYSDIFSGQIIALDRSKSSENEPYIVEIELGFNRDEFFDLFKRLNVVLISRLSKHDEFSIKETIHFDE